MRYLLLSLICFVSLISCKNPEKRPIPITEEISQFEILGNLDKNYIKKVYLNSVFGQSLIPIDSCQIVAGKFQFSGALAFPDRYAVSFDTDPSVVIFILENKVIEMNFGGRDLSEPNITGSPLNTELAEYKMLSRSIFKEIDNLYPEFQRARLENDVVKLETIGKEMKRIDNAYRDFSFDYIRKHSTSFISAIVLSDHLKTETPDTLRIRENYLFLSDEVKKSVSAQMIAEFLQLP